MNTAGSTVISRGDSTTAGCPVCGECQSLRPLDHFPIADLIAEYERQFGTDIRGEFPHGMNGLDLYECDMCGMQFFIPLLAGSSSFYRGLSLRQATYYSQNRWEFDFTLNWLTPQSKVVDVGCGDGHFLSRLARGQGLGLEFNPEAVKRSRARGLDARLGTLTDLEDESADMITLFQVLEHITSPIPLLKDAVRVLRHNGLLVVAVPNNDGFMGSAFQEPLNAPPHHPLRWRKAPLQHLCKLLPLRLEALETEPLAPEHLFAYRKAVVTGAIETLVGSRLPKMKRSLPLIMLRKAVHMAVLVSLKIHNRLPDNGAFGHSLVAAFRKTS